MKIAFISSEVYPFSKTGGLADVAGALPPVLKKLSHSVKVFTPLYGSIEKEKFKLMKEEDLSGISIEINGKLHYVNVFRGILPEESVEVYLIDYPEYFSSKSYYEADQFEDLRFILFQKFVLELLLRLKWSPDVVHVNDWQTSLIPYYLKEKYSSERIFQNTFTLLTIHNVGYQGLFPEATLHKAEINPAHFYLTGPAEFYGKVSFLKLGIVFSDLINTVSKTYAEELLTDEFSGGLKDVFISRKKDLFGIVNGVDYSIWNPESDKLIPQNYSLDSLNLKEKNKISLASEFNLDYYKDIPILGIISRLVSQKGFDLFFDLFDELIGMNAQLIVLGSGDKKYETFFKKAEFFSSGNIKTHLDYNNDLAHLIEAGADIFLMPSLYEPCGLNQIYSLKYGTVPVVRKTGGLADTVEDWDESIKRGTRTGTGFSFSEFSSDKLWETILRALKYYQDKPTWRQIQINGMKRDFSWEKSAEEYVNLYKTGIGRKRILSK